MANRFLIVCGGTGYKLLGQRNILELDAEMQIDVSTENISQNWKVTDQRSMFLDLDRVVGTTTEAFEESLKFHNSNSSEKEIKHAQLLVDLFPAALSLEHGLAQSPAVGRAAIQHPNNVQALEQAISTMITQYGRNIGQKNPVEGWIVSSTSGGTGEGTHLFVARKIAQYMKETYPDTNVTLKFIRIGQLTYRSVGNESTALNTFLGVAMDSAFMTQAKEKFNKLVTNWFYIDLPDVGKGDTAKKRRGEIVENACKAIMLPELQEPLQKLLVNNTGAPIVLVRTGYWGHDFGSNLKYLETLKQLSIKLADLVEPNYQKKYIEDKTSPLFISPPELDDAVKKMEDTRFITTRMNDGWTFPHYKISGTIKDLNQVEALIGSWKNNLRDLLDFDFDDLQVDFLTTGLSSSGEGNQKQISLKVPGTIQEDERWINEIDNVHCVKAWAYSMLGVDLREHSLLGTGLITTLLKQADQISKIFYGFDIFSSGDKKARNACSQMGQFVNLLAQVNRLIGLARSSSRLLDSELSEVRDVFIKTNNEFKLARNVIGDSTMGVVRAANLDQVLDQLGKKTWLRLLRDAVRKGDKADKEDSSKFREEVLRGAIGLTEDGLRDVLGLPSNANIPDIQNELAKNIGQMVDENGTKYEGQWWQATIPNPTMHYEYRILPQVDEDLQSRLVAFAAKNLTSYSYVFSEFGTIGLYVLAFLAVSLNNKKGDTESSPAFLLKPLLSHVQNALKYWPEKPEPREPSGQLDIVMAGAGGQVLYEKALRGAGLSEEEIQKLAQYYELYN